MPRVNLRRRGLGASVLLLCLRGGERISRKAAIEKPPLIFYNSTLAASSSTIGINAQGNAPNEKASNLVSSAHCFIHSSAESDSVPKCFFGFRLAWGGHCLPQRLKKHKGGVQGNHFCSFMLCVWDKSYLFHEQKAYQKVPVEKHVFQGSPISFYVGSQTQPHAHVTRKGLWQAITSISTPVKRAIPREGSSSPIALIILGSYWRVLSIGCRESSTPDCE